MTFLIDSDLNLIELDTEHKLLTKVVDLHKNWQQIRSAIPEDKQLQDVFELLSRLTEYESYVSNVLQNLGFDEPGIKELSEYLIDKHGDDIDPRLKLLLKPLSYFKENEKENSGEIVWKFLSLKESKTGNKLGGRLGFSLGGSIDASMSAEAADRTEDIDDDDSLLRITLNGDVLGNASLAPNIDWGKVSFSGKGQITKSLNYWYETDENDLNRFYGEVLANELVKIANPFDFESVSAALLNEKLARIELKSDMMLNKSLSMEFNIAPQFDARVIKNTISFDVNTKREQKLELELYSEDGINIDVDLVRSHLKSQRQKSFWELGIDVSDIAEGVKKYIEKIDDDYKGVLKKFEEYLKPGTWAKKELQGYMDELASELDGKLDMGKDKLQELLVQKLDATPNLLTMKITGHTEKFIASMDLPLKVNLDADVIDKVEAKLKGLQEKLIGKLELEIDDLFDSEIKHTLGEIKGDIELQIDELADEADDKLENARKVIAKFGGIIEKLTSNLEKATTAKLNLLFSIESTVTSGIDASLFLRLKNTSESGTIYKNLVQGDYEYIKGILNNDNENVLIKEGSKVKDFIERVVTKSVVISLLGLELSEKAIFKSNVSITTDTDGNVIIADMRSERSIQSMSEAQSVGYMSHFQLWSARRMGSGNISLSAGQKDKNLKQDELEDFLDDLLELKLISKKVFDDTLSELARRRLGSSKISANVEAKMLLNREAIANLLFRNSSLEPADLIKSIAGTLAIAGVHSEKSFKKIAREAHKFCSPKPPKSQLPNIVYEHFRALKVNSTGKAGAWNWFLEKPFAQTHVNDIVVVRSSSGRKLRKAATIHHMVKGYALLITNIKRLSTLDPIEANKEEIDKLHQEIDFYLKPWLKVSRLFITHPQDELHRKLLAFFILIARESGIYDGDDEDEDGHSSSMSISLMFDDGTHFIATD